MNIDIKALANANGVGQKHAKTIIGVFNSYSDLAVATAEELTSVVSGLTNDAAQAAINFAKIKSRAQVAQSSSPVISTTNTTLGVEEVTTNPARIVKAPEGTTAVKKVMRYNNQLAKQLGLQNQSYTGCSHCRSDLDEAAQEHSISLDAMRFCPYCEALFVVANETYCYACSTKMANSGKCLHCAASLLDSEDVKLMTIFVRKQDNKSGRVAISAAKNLLEDLVLTRQVTAQGKTENWILSVEGGSPVTGQPFRFGSN